jgi:methyl-accepting chemotaxis protein
VRSVGKITELIGEIAIDSKDQAGRIYQINQELSQIDQITQSNTANAEETAATAEQLAGQTTYLEELLDNFKVDEDANDSYMVGKQPGGGKQQLLETE